MLNIPARKVFRKIEKERKVGAILIKENISVSERVYPESMCERGQGLELEKNNCCATTLLAIFYWSLTTGKDAVSKFAEKLQ